MIPLVRIATWNLERPRARSWRKGPAQLAQIAQIDADVWILTETRQGLQPAAGYYGIECPPHPTRRPVDESWAAVWSRSAVKASGVPVNPRGTVSGVVETRIGPMVIYGTVIPWANEPGDDPTRKAKMWSLHEADIERQGEEWRQLRILYPDYPLVVAGDFNQDRDGSGWYGTRRGRELLTEALDRAGLECITSLDVVAAGILKSHHLVDHICISSDLSERFQPLVRCWEASNNAGIKMSDHPAVAVDLVPR